MKKITSTGPRTPHSQTTPAPSRASNTNERVVESVYSTPQFTETITIRESVGTGADPKSKQPAIRRSAPSPTAPRDSSERSTEDASTGHGLPEGSNRGQFVSEPGGQHRKQTAQESKTGQGGPHHASVHPWAVMSSQHSSALRRERDQQEVSPKAPSAPGNQRDRELHQKKTTDQTGRRSGSSKKSTTGNK